MGQETMYILYTDGNGYWVRIGSTEHFPMYGDRPRLSSQAS
jgi:hypothetical protein